jgi:hypothetical protein
VPVPVPVKWSLPIFPVRFVVVSVEPLIEVRPWNEAEMERCAARTIA